MDAQTPLKLSKEITGIAKKVSRNSNLVFIDVAPAPNAVVEECFENVNRHAEKYTGSAVYGWNIFVWPRVWVEMEAHAVWRDSNGVLHDITPRRDNEKVVLFLEDKNATYKGLRQDNLRFSLSTMPIVHKMIAVAEQMFNVRFAKQQPYSNEVLVDIKKLQCVTDHMHTLKNTLNWSPKRNDPCPCGSRKKYKKCCG